MASVGEDFIRSARSARALDRDARPKKRSPAPLQTVRSAASSDLGPIPAPHWPTKPLYDSFQLHKRINAGFMVHPLQTQSVADLRDFYADAETRAVLEKEAGAHNKHKGLFSDYLNEALKSGPMFIKKKRNT
jgi:hypothetical protein